MVVTFPAHGRAALSRRSAAQRRRLRDPFPAHPVARHLLRAALAAPFVVLAVLLSRQPALLDTTVNAALDARVGAIDWFRGDLVWLAELYPPAGVLLARAIPFGALGLSLAGALGAGWFLQYLIQTMRDKGWRPRNIALMTVAVGANPVFALLAVTNLLDFLGLVAFGFGAIEMFRFVTMRNTDAGFRAGVWFLLCSLVAPSGILLVVVALIAVPSLSVARARERGARLANILVIFFPTFAAALSLVFLGALFLRSPFALYEHAIHYDGARWAVFGELFTTRSGRISLFVTLLGILIGALSRRAAGVFLPPLVLLVVLLGKVLGIVPVDGAGYVLLATAMITLALLPRLETRTRRVGVTVLIVALIVLGWMEGLPTFPVTDWFQTLLGGIS